jgi:hypothetical protein
MLTTLVYQILRFKLQRIDPAEASLFILVWLAVPPLAALLTTYIVYSPDIAQWLVAGHCHADVCQVHGPQTTLAIFPTAVLAGWMVFRDIDCILLHEAAHRQRRDNLRLLAARALTAPLPANWSARALDDLKLSCEKACDLRAAAKMSPENVASALVRVTKVQQHAAPTASLAFVGNFTEQRILALLSEPQPPLANHLLFAAASAVLIVVLAMINPLHRAVELLA